MSTTSHHRHLLGSLIFLSLFFLIFQFCLFLPLIIHILTANNLVQGDLPFAGIMVPAILGYISIHILLWFSVAIVVYKTTLAWQHLLKSHDTTAYIYGISLWILTTFSILLANQILYPRSMFSDLMRTIIPDFFAYFILIFLVVILAIVFGFGLFNTLYRFFKKHPVAALVFIFISVTFSGFFPLKKYFFSNQDSLSSQGPNIIIIGIDSLRVDEVGFYGNPYHRTPHLDQFLKEAINFRNAFTTLGRTFAAWVSILTGEYPIHNGARDDLTPFNKIHIEDSFTFILQKAGYETLYATDERRFSNIDKSFGFNEIIGPKTGANDFLLGTANDYPLSNLITNFKIGRYLFPYNYANRASAITYRPSTFTAWLTDFFKKPHPKPLFLAIHLCIPHWPYVWADSSPHAFPFYDFDMARQAYAKGVVAGDLQFSELMNHLKQYHLLDNALVIVMSDHGESLVYPGDRLTTVTGYQGTTTHTFQQSAFGAYIKQLGQAINESNGHGTDVLSPSQNHIVLAMRYYGKNLPPNFKVQTVWQNTSLVDLKATILDFLKLPLGKQDGTSLISSTALLTPRPIFLETGFSPDAIRLANPQLTDLLAIGMQYYIMDPKNGYLELKESMIPKLVASKQRAVIWKDWELALYPFGENWIPVLINLKTYQWTDNPNTPFAKQGPFKELLKTLLNFYKADLNNPLLKGYYENLKLIQN